MSVTFKYEPVLKGLPGLETAAGPSSLPPEVYQGGQSISSPAYLPLFPQWFRQNQQRLILEQAEKRLAALELKYQNLYIPNPDIIWTLPELVKNSQSSAPAFGGSAVSAENLHVSFIWPVSANFIISRSLPANAPAEAASGHYIMRLALGDDEYQIQVSVSTAYGRVDSHISLLRQIAAAINRQQTKVRALVREEAQPDIQTPYRLPENRARLKIETLLPGLDFSLRDQQGDLAARYGLNTQVSGGLAQYRSPGQSLASRKEQARLEDIVGISRQKDGSLKTEPGPLPLILGIDLFLRDYNDTLSYLDLNCDHLRPALKDRLISPQQNLFSRLPDLGLEVNAQGYIKPGERLAGCLLSNFSSVHQYLLAGDKAWAPAFIAQISSLRQIGLNNYLAEPRPLHSEQARSRIWADLEEVKHNIVNAYY